MGLPRLERSFAKRPTRVEFLRNSIFQPKWKKIALSSWNYTTWRTIKKQVREEIARTHLMSLLRQTCSKRGFVRPSVWSSVYSLQFQKRRPKLAENSVLIAVGLIHWPARAYFPFCFIFFTIRFGTEKYNLSNLENVYSHLTNTSINKFR